MGIRSAKGPRGGTPKGRGDRPSQAVPPVHPPGRAADNRVPERDTTYQQPAENWFRKHM